MNVCSSGGAQGFGVCAGVMEMAAVVLKQSNSYFCGDRDAGGVADVVETFHNSSPLPQTAGFSILEKLLNSRGIYIRHLQQGGTCSGSRCRCTENGGK